MRKDTKFLYSSAVLSALGTAAGIAFVILPMLTIWAGMLYLTQIITGINFLPPDDILSLTLVIVTIATIGEGMMAYFIWEKVLDKIKKREAGSDKNK